jgi:periplasmic protein TonB
MGETADIDAPWKAGGRIVTSAMVRERHRLARSGPLPRRRWIAASVTAVILHLASLAVFLLVPSASPEDTEPPQTVVVTLVPEPSAAPDVSPVSQPSPEASAAEPADAEPEQRPPSDTPQEPPPPEAMVPPQDAPVPPPEPAVPPADIPRPPPPEAPVPMPDVSPPPPEARVRTPEPPAPARPVVLKLASPRPRPVAPAPKAASPSPGPQAEPRSPAASAPSENVVDPYRRILAAHVQSYQRYPALARNRHEEGLVELRVTIRRNGTIVAISVEHSSGSDILDREALATLKRADPLPPIPAGVPGPTIELIFPLGFHLE